MPYIANNSTFVNTVNNLRVKIVSLIAATQIRLVKIASTNTID